MFDDVLSHIQKEIEDSDFKIITFTDWSSSHQGHRLQIRQHIAENYSAFFKRDQMAKLFDLTQIPQPENVSLSISHCASVGGYVFSHYNVGFDIEEKKRISPSVLKRVCSSAELNSAPDPAFLWSAKESAYKALSKQMISFETHFVMTDVICSNWVHLNHKGLWGYQIDTALLKNEKVGTLIHKNLGYAFYYNECVVSVYFN